MHLWSSGVLQNIEEGVDRSNGGVVVVEEGKAPTTICSCTTQTVYYSTSTSYVCAFPRISVSLLFKGGKEGGSDRGFRAVIAFLPLLSSAKLPSSWA
jgi:hypothetical protein